MSHPARPELRFATFDQMLADVDRLRSGPYEKAGKWDLGMILEHLAKTMSVPFTGGTRSMPWPASAIARLVIHRMVKRDKYPGIRFPAPGLIRPAAEVDAEAAYTEFVRAVELVKAAPGETINAPPFGVMEMTDYRGLQLLHGSHHLGFLKPSVRPGS